MLHNFSRHRCENFLTSQKCCIESAARALAKTRASGVELAQKIASTTPEFVEQFPRMDHVFGARRTKLEPLPLSATFHDALGNPKRTTHYSAEGSAELRHFHYNAERNRLLSVARDLGLPGGEQETIRSYAYDEAGYVWLPPCVWADDDARLPRPPVLGLDTRLTSIKRVNSTFEHYGVMAIWQMRAAYET